MCIVFLIWSVRFPLSDSVPSAWVLVYSELDCPTEWSSQSFSNNGSSCQDHTFPLRWLGSDSALSPWSLPQVSPQLVWGLAMHLLCCLEAISSFVVLGIELRAPHMPNKCFCTELYPALFLLFILSHILTPLLKLALNSLCGTGKPWT